MTLVQTEPKKIYLGNNEVKAVYLGENKVRQAAEPVPTTVTVTDATNVVANSTNRTNGYYYGIKFTALKTGKITKVAFLYNGTHSATLKIAQGAYASANGTTYNYTADASGEYELPTPYDITEGVSYVVSINTGNYNYFSYRSTGSYPITGTAVRYDYSTYSGNSAQYTNATYTIKSLTIEYTP